MTRLRQEWQVALVVVALCLAVIVYVLVVRHAGIGPTTTGRP